VTFAIPLGGAEDAYGSAIDMGELGALPPTGNLEDVDVGTVVVVTELNSACVPCAEEMETRDLSVAEADAAHDENNHFSCVNVRNYATPSLAAAVDSFLLFLVLSL